MLTSHSLKSHCDHFAEKVVLQGNESPRPGVSFPDLTSTLYLVILQTFPLTFLFFGSFFVFHVFLCCFKCVCVYACARVRAHMCVLYMPAMCGCVHILRYRCIWRPEINLWCISSVMLPLYVSRKDLSLNSSSFSRLCLLTNELRALPVPVRLSLSVLGFQNPHSNTSFLHAFWGAKFMSSYLRDRWL